MADRPTIAPDGRIDALEAAPPPSSRDWTEAELAALRRYSGRVRVADIARALGRTVDSVNKAVGRYKLQRRVAGCGAA